MGLHDCIYCKRFHDNARLHTDGIYYMRMYDCIRLKDWMGLQNCIGIARNYKRSYRNCMRMQNFMGLQEYAYRSHEITRNDMGLYECIQIARDCKERYA